MAMPGQRQLGTACKELKEKPGNADAKIGLISALAQGSPPPPSLLSLAVLLGGWGASFGIKEGAGPAL